jgi:hypothetical protein
MNRSRWTRWALSVATALALAAPAFGSAQTPDAAKLVASATARNGFGFDHGSARVRLSITGGDQAPKERVLRARTLRGSTGGARTVLRFLSPSEVQGAAFLLVEQPGDAPDDMHLYLPDLKRTRRIAGSQKDGSFMGTDFTYADLEYRDVKTAAYSPVTEASLDGVPCWRVEARPTAPAAGVSRVVLHIRRDNGLIQRSELFGADDRLLKRYSLRDFATVDGQPAPSDAEMHTVETGRTTRLTIDEVDTRAPLDPADVTPESLSRG